MKLKHRVDVATTANKFPLPFTFSQNAFFFPLKKFNLMKSKTNPITDMDAYNVKIGLTYPLNRSRSLHFRQF